MSRSNLRETGRARAWAVIVSLFFASVTSCGAPHSTSADPNTQAGVLHAAATEPPVRSEQRMSTEVDGRQLAYALWTPVGEAPRDGWPLVLFLHGAGERGDDLARVDVHGPPKLAATMPQLWGSVIVAPQCPAGVWWTTEPLVALLDDVRRDLPIDVRRTYVTGLSMGGFGTFELVATHPELFAAAVPICGGMQAEREAAIVAAKGIPMRVFHGAADTLVPPDMSERVVAHLASVGADVELTVYPGVGHDSWSATYADPALWAWLFAQRR
jgi:predicted peptidase